MVHPTVQTAPVEYMPAIREPSDLIVPIKLVQANRAALRRVNQLRELHHRQQLPDQRRRHRMELRVRFGSGRERHFGFEEISETQNGEKRANELPDETQNCK
ncbi:hypothetical protein HAX54_011680 [Datura stramonium]|uniref:Uncharacterized protein n=1 Tax=Datura stramonium TaxID=4076 RepID=A0ABS8TLB3_DATST|nr:hypothetical protein [Datura stramonium]